MTSVLLVSDSSLFARGLEDILRDKEGVELVGSGTHNDGLVGCIEQHRPEVLLVDCTDPGECPVLGLLGHACEGEARAIVCVSLSDNSVVILRRERQVLRDVEDLVTALTGGTATTCVPEPSDCALEVARGGKEEGRATISASDHLTGDYSEFDS